MKNVTYRHTSGEEVTYTGPNGPMETSKAWARVDGPAYSALLKPALVELCEQRGLDPVGTKPELVTRLEEHDAGLVQPPA